MNYLDQIFLGSFIDLSNCSLRTYRVGTSGKLDSTPLKWFSPNHCRGYLTSTPCHLLQRGVINLQSHHSVPGTFKLKRERAKYQRKRQKRTETDSYCIDFLLQVCVPPFVFEFLVTFLLFYFNFVRFLIIFDGF